ncbi:CapA family protein [Catenulispora subtropica]|uniref:CapA family protein n=1 Tax=Catenulispora subtropica TaxID=450798 RepID=A0ABN2QCR3_9ACTN
MIDGLRPATAGRADGTVRLFLAGDVMTGRGIDQILPHPGDPLLRENWVRDARRYVELAEAVNGPIPLPVGFEWIWGDALVTLAQVAPAVSVINLETAVTGADDFVQGKGIHYRMNPRNLPAIVVARPDVCVLANNHVLDFDRTGLSDTLSALAGAGLATVGAGEDLEEARRPAVVPVPGTSGRVIVAACAMASAGVPDGWAAKRDRSGVWFAPSLADAVADDIVERLGAVRRPGDICVVSLHWGSNWGFEMSHDQVRFAHRLVDGGVDVVYGHSSHHPRPIEVYRRRLILYGCGDLVNDYEGIPGQEEFRSELRLLYFPTVHQSGGELAGLTMRAVRARRMRLENALPEDVLWLERMLGETSGRFKTRIETGPDGTLMLVL